MPFLDRVDFKTTKYVDTLPPPSPPPSNTDDEPPAGNYEEAQVLPPLRHIEFLPLPDLTEPLPDLTSVCCNDDRDDMIAVVCVFLFGLAVGITATKILTMEHSNGD